MAESGKAEQHWLAALHIYRQQYGPTHPATLRAQDGLYWVYDDQERHYDAEHLRREMLDIGPDIDTDIDGEEYGGNQGALAHTLHHLGKYEEAEALYNKIVAVLQREQGEDYFRFFPFVACNLARVYADQGRYEQAEHLFLRTLEAAAWDSESRWRLVYTADQANMYRDQGRFQEAERLLVQTLETERRVLGHGHVFTLRSMCYLARLYTAQDRYEEAGSLLNEALKISCTQLRPNHPATLRFVNALAVLRTKQHKYSEAQALFQEALAGRLRELGAGHPHTLDTRHEFGVLNLSQDNYPEAELMLHAACKGRTERLGAGHPHTIHSIEALIRLYEAWGKPNEAKAWRDRHAKGLHQAF